MGGIHVQGDVRLRVTGGGVIVLDNLRIGPIDAEIGPLGVQGLQIDYARATQEWKGQGELCVVVVCLDAREIPGEAPPGGVLIRNGQLVRAYANLDFPDPGITLFAGVQLNRIGAGIGLGPTRFLGGARLTALGIFQVDGALVLALPTDATPFVLTREENGNDFPADFYGRPYKRFTLALGADASLKVPLLSDPIGLAKAYFLYEAPGYVAFGGGVRRGLLRRPLAQRRRRRRVQRRQRALQPERPHQGMRRRRRLRKRDRVPVERGRRRLRHPQRVLRGPQHRRRRRLPPVRHQALALRRVSLDALQGRQRVHGPGGPGRPADHRAHRPGGSAAMPSRWTPPRAPRASASYRPEARPSRARPARGPRSRRAVRILRSEQLHQTVVGLVDPRPGTYTIETLPGSPAITKVAEATDPLPARVTASVHGHGARRTLAYDIRRRPQQTVTFLEVSGVTRRPIGTVSGGRGTLAFTPAPGSDVRHIVAQFTLDGIRAETRTVASFRPPSSRLGRPAHLRVRRRASTLIVSWRPVPGATRYELVTTSPSAGQRVARARGAGATLRRVPLTSAGRVSVRAVAPMRHGAPASAPFRATRHLRTRFGTLPRASRALQRG